MKIYVSVDLEGLPGVASLTMLNPWSSQFNRPVKILSRLLNALSEELFNNGATEVYIADSHGLMVNIDYNEMDGRVNLIQGYPRPYSMLTGLDSSFDTAMFIGYHAAAGTIHGVLDHTMSGRAFSEIFVNDIKFSEFLLNSLFAGEKGVPVALLAGDEYLKEEVEKYYPECVFVPLKKGLSRYSAMYPGIDRVVELLRRGTREAIEKVRSKRIKPFRLQSPYKARIVLRDSLVADVLEEMSGIKRTGAYTVEYVAENAAQLLGTIEIIAYIAYGIDSLKNNIR